MLPDKSDPRLQGLGDDAHELRRRRARGRAGVQAGLQQLRDGQRAVVRDPAPARARTLLGRPRRARRGAGAPWLQGLMTGALLPVLQF